MDAEKFIERINEAEKVLKYTFRLELEDDGADDFGKSLIERSACQAYKMFEPLIADRWSGHPFLTNRMLLKDSLCYEKRKELEEKIKESDEKTKEHDERIKKLDERIKKLDEIIKKPDEFDEKIKNILVKDAIASIYCMVREIIGEEDRITTYAAGEYAYFDEKAFEEEDEEEKEKYANEKKKKKRKNLSKFTTGMDDLLVRESYKFSEKGSLILEKGHIESDRSEILRSRNRALTRSITGLDNKLAGFPGYNPFITNKEVKVKSTDVKEGKVITIEKIENRPYLRISDLDMAAIFRRSSSRWNVIGKIAGTSNNDTIDIKYLCELNGLCKSLNSMDSIEHMTRADKLYVQIKIEKLLNYSALVCLWKNICELADSEYKVLFYDKESVKMLSDCFAMDNVIYRADFLNMEFESLKDYEELQEKEKNRVMDTWKTEIKDCLMKTIMRQNEEKENLTLNHWKDKETDSTELQKIAVHEAAHAVVGEVLHPGSIGIVTVRGSQGVIGGMANGCATYAQNEEEFLDEVTKTLAGRAGVSLIYGVMDIQASADIEQADKLMDIWLCHFAGGGFVGIESGDNRMSEQRLSYNEAIKSTKLEELYRRAYKILHNNKYFLLAVQHGLLEHETLLNSDLAKIRESCI